MRALGALPPPPPGAALSDIPIAWRVWNARAQWARLFPSEFVSSVITHGYQLPFVSAPPTTHRPNGAICHTYSDFVDSTIAELLRGGCVVRCASRPWIVCGLSVDDSRDKLRLIFDGRPVNQHLFKEHFRYDSIYTARDVFSEGAWTYQFDVTSAYHHIRVHPDHWGCLGFAWRGSYYAFCVLPFGLSTAPFVFTKVMKTLVTSWRRQGIPVIMMLDDGLGGDKDEVVARQHAHIVSSDLRACGITVNDTKSHWVPAQTTPAYLGYAIDFRRNLLSVKLERLVKVMRALIDLSPVNPVPRRRLASLTGQIMSMYPVLGNSARVHTRALYALVGGLPAHGRWDQLLRWNAEAAAELRWWRQAAVDGLLQAPVPFWPPPLPPPISTIHTDASDHGLGCTFSAPGQPQLGSAAPIELEHIAESSTFRELLAVVYALDTFAPLAAGQVLALVGDNQAAVRILTVGSRVPACHRLAIQALQIAADNHIQLRPQWVPRDLNEQADAWSRERDFDDWFLSPATFQRVNRLFGPFEVDLFASHRNTKCTAFFSRWPCPGSVGVDFFLQPWPAARCWACPPFPLALRLLARLLHSPPEHAVAVVLPHWPSQPWWPLLFPDGVHAIPQVSCLLPLSREDFECGRCGRPDFLLQTSWRFSVFVLLWVPVPCAGALPVCLSSPSFACTCREP